MLTHLLHRVPLLASGAHRHTMFLLIGSGIVLTSVIGGYLLNGGHLVVL